MPDNLGTVARCSGTASASAGTGERGRAAVGLYGSTSVQPDACSELDPYTRGYRRGYAEAAERELRDDATADDADTWLVNDGPLLRSDADARAYENGWGDAWSDYFTGRGYQSLLGD